MTRYWRTDPLDPNPTPRHKNEKGRLSLKWSCFIHTHWHTHTQKHTPAESSAPSVCSEWNQWVPKGSGGDFCVNSLCLKVKWGKGEAYGGEHSRGEENRAKTNGGVFREKEVSFLTQNAPWSPSYQEEWKARVCSSKRICMAWWALL